MTRQALCRTKKGETDMTAYVIESNGLYWSCNYGWADLEDADLYTYEEHMCLNLPIDGQWVCLDMEGIKL